MFIKFCFGARSFNKEREKERMQLGGIHEKGMVGWLLFFFFDDLVGSL